MMDQDLHIFSSVCNNEFQGENNVLISGHCLLNIVTSDPRKMSWMDAIWPAVWNRFDSSGL